MLQPRHSRLGWSSHQQSIFTLTKTITSPLPVDRNELAKLDLTPSEARSLQERIAPMVVRSDRLGRVRTVAAADIALIENTGFAAVVVYSFPKLEELERASYCGDLTFPYIPGLLSFREIPLLLHAFEKLSRRPDLILADAHGYAHPRRAGLACHLGLVLDTPTIGCAKSVLIGDYEMPAFARGSTSPLRHRGEVIGTALRTRDGVRPIFVSCGHRVSLPTGVRLTLACCDGYRIPKPLRETDHWTKEMRRKFQARR